MKLPSPSMSMTGMSGFVAVAPSAAGKLKPIAPSPAKSNMHKNKKPLRKWKECRTSLTLDVLMLTPPPHCCVDMIHPIVINTNCNAERKSETQFQKTDLLMWATNRVSYIYITEQPRFYPALHLWRGCHCLLWAHKAFELCSQFKCFVSWGASNLGNVICHFCFCSSSSANQLEKSGTLFCPCLCGKKESNMQLLDHCTILHHTNNSDIAAPTTTCWLTSSAPKSDELPWLLADWLHQLLTVSVGWIEQHSVWWCLNKTHQWLSITTAKEKSAVLPQPLWLVWSRLQELYHRGIAICCRMSFGISTRSGPRRPDVVRKKVSWIIWGMLSTFITRWSCLVMDLSPAHGM